MAWEFDNTRPIYLQLMEQIQTMILSGEYPLGSQLPPVRELAQIAAVNPNTLQKAFTELELTGLIYAKRTAGRFVTQDITLLDNLRDQLATQETRRYLQNMANLGLDADACLQQLQQRNF